MRIARSGGPSRRRAACWRFYLIAAAIARTFGENCNDAPGNEIHLNDAKRSKSHARNIARLRSRGANDEGRSETARRSRRVQPTNRSSGRRARYRRRSSKGARCPNFALLPDCNVESIRGEAQAAVNRRRHIAHLFQKSAPGAAKQRTKLMSIFGNIGTFIRTSAQGVVEAVITLFQSSHPKLPRHCTPINTSDTLDHNSSSGSDDLELAMKTLAGDVTNCSHGGVELNEPLHFEFAEPAVSAQEVAADSAGKATLSRECCDPELATTDVSPQNTANGSPGRVSSETCDLEFATPCISAGDAASKRSKPDNNAVRKSAPKKKTQVAKKAAAKTPKQGRSRAGASVSS